MSRIGFSAGPPENERGILIEDGRWRRMGNKLISCPFIPASMLLLAWTYLILAGIMEPCWVIGMKMSDGFKKVGWTIVTTFFIFASMYLLALAMALDIPVGTAYAIWTGIGAVGTLVAGVVLFKERAARVRVLFILLILVGIMGVQITSGA